MKLKKNKDQSVDTLTLLRKGNNGRSYTDNIWSCDKMMDHLMIAISRDPSHNQLPNADTIAYTSKIMLNGP